MWEKVWRWADVKRSRCERRCGNEQMWRWADVREDVREDVKMSRCERRCADEQMWRWADVREDVREDVKVSRCERRCEDEQMWRWADVREDVKMSRCEDEQMWEKIWRWADVREDVKMSRCERRCEDEKMFYRPPLLEEPCAQTLSGKMGQSKIPIAPIILSIKIAICGYIMSYSISGHPMFSCFIERVEATQASWLPQCFPPGEALCSAAGVPRCWCPWNRKELLWHAADSHFQDLKVLIFHIIREDGPQIVCVHV